MIATPPHEADIAAAYADFTQQFIAGRWRRGRSEGVNNDRNPYSGETLVEIPQASAADLDDAHESAARAQVDWAARMPGERAKTMRRVDDACEDQPVNNIPFSPFGGERNSGIGRFNGRWAIDAFTTDHWITLQHTPRPYPRSATMIKGPWAGG